MIKRNIKKMFFLFIYYWKVKYADIVLLDTPTHKNLGDQAITIAELQYLRSAEKKYNILEVPADVLDGMEKLLSLCTPNRCLIMVHGGGFLGSIWPLEEERFRRILQNFLENKIIVFPQTVTFDMLSEEDRCYFENSKRIYENHKNLIICLREKKSFEFFKQYMSTVKTLLVPDIVTLLEIKNIGLEAKNNEIIFCFRNDIERNIETSEKENTMNYTAQKYPQFMIRFSDTVIIDDKLRCINKRNRIKFVRDKIVEFSRARLIITDRLHGMLFAYLANTPCIALNNKNGKIEGVYEWISNSNFIKLAHNYNEFEECLNNMNIDKEYYRDSMVEKFQSLETEINKS